ncbi:MAG TPA: phosphoadenylyl-sulfate reductase [Anaerolineales bacterium]|nr:phosphoadenylyl-sulfate reductase [Anaerolineales bacterium]
MFSTDEIERLSEAFETKTPQEIICWAVDTFWPQVALSSSFQTQSVPLLHMAWTVRRDILIFFLDTGYHFWETHMFRERLASHYQLNVLDIYRDARWDEFARERTRSLPVDDPNLCCYIHKVEPMQRALKDMKAWISGIRRDQTSVRAQAKILELQDDGLLKINPLLNWTKEDIRKYSEEQRLPAHPLFQHGYRSIGCAPCTIAVGLNDDERAGRWTGRDKIECGLHTSMFKQKNLDEVKQDFKLETPDVNNL